MNSVGHIYIFIHLQQYIILSPVTITIKVKEVMNSTGAGLEV